jgi:pimeloyl-ACP methyl ester carboxylesterase
MAPFTQALSALEERFVVCLWEQRGAGLSYACGRTPEGLSLSRFVSDAVEVTEYLLKRFGRKKLVLMGFSWGSLVGILAASKAPSLYSAYIGVGQIADQRLSERDAYAQTLEKARRAGDQGSVAALEKLGPPPYSGNKAVRLIMKERAILRKYSDNSAGTVRLSDFLMKILTCPYYKASDKINYFRGVKAGAPLFAEVLETSLIDAPPAVAAPVYILPGKHDMQTRPAYAEKLLDRLAAPEKKIILFENAGHSPHEDDPEAFLGALDSLPGVYDPWS